MRNPIRLGLLALVAAGLAGPYAWASNWPRFRGPNGTGVAEDKEVPVKWTEQDGVLWKTEIPGLGNSSPVVWEKKIFLQTASEDGKERQLLCLDATSGKSLWSQSVPGVVAKKHPKNTLASSTPAVDGERVYAVFWDGSNLHCNAYDLSGGPIWKRDLGKFTSLQGHGAACSPVVYNGKVYLANDQDVLSVVQALDARTGKTLWEKERKFERTCYSTPFVRERPDGKAEVVVSSTTGVTGYDPQTGEENWTCTWSYTGMPLRTVASHVAAKGMVFVNCGDGSGERQTVAVKFGDKGDVSGTNVVWTNKDRSWPYVPSMLAVGDYLYFVSDKPGFAGCCELKTGATVFHERLGGDMTASPVLIDGKVYAPGEDGNVYVFAAEPKFRLLAKNPLSEPLMASPAVADGRLFLRGKNHLFCIGKPSTK